MMLQPLLSVGAGLLAGCLVGALVIGIRASGAEALDAVSSTVPTVVALAVAAVLGLGLVFRWPASGQRAAGWLLNAALVVSAGVAILLLAGPSSDAVGPLAISTILALVLATGLLAARLWAPFGTALAWMRRGQPGLSLPSVGATVAQRRPLLRLFTAGFVAASCCLLVFAGGYRSSLDQSAFDQAAAQVPLDVSISPSAQVAAPLQVVDVDRLQAAAPGVGIYPVVSASVSAFAGSPLAKGLPLVGIDTAALPQLHEFAATTGAEISGAAAGRPAGTC